MDRSTNREIEPGFKWCLLCGLAFPVWVSGDISNCWACQRLCGRLALLSRREQLEAWLNYMTVCSVIRTPEIEPEPEWWAGMRAEFLKSGS
jgi:hypothetical protein